MNFKKPSLEQLNNLIKYYQTRRFVDAEKLSLSITQEFPKHPFAWKVLAVVLKLTGRISESLVASQKSVQLDPQDSEAYNNLGSILQKLLRLDEAEASCRQAIALKPDYAEAYNNLGSILQELGKLNEAEVSYRKAIALKPDFAEAHYNLGSILQELGRLNEAEASYCQAKILKPDFAEAHNNLGSILQKLLRLDEAEANCRQAIALKPDYAEAYNNLGNTLKQFRRLDEAEVCYNKSIDLKSDYTDAHNNLDLLLRENKVLMNIFNSKKYFNNNKIRNIDSALRLTSNPFISKREVEKNIISNLYKIRLKQLDKTKGPKTKGPLYGNGKTTDFRFFENNKSILKNVENDLSKIMKQAVESEVYVYESFLNIFNSGSGSIPHIHITSFDKTNNLINQKFSLQYYLSVGDQDCSEPGIFKLDNPDEEILPSNGMVMIIPANRHHSAVYNGKLDRVMIGVNFYSLL